MKGVFVYLIGLHAVQLEIIGWKKSKNSQNYGRVQYGCQRNFLNSTIFKLDKHVVPLLINYIGWLVNPDFFSVSQTRNIVHSNPSVCIWNKNTLQYLKKVYSYSVIELILYKWTNVELVTELIALSYFGICSQVYILKNSFDDTVLHVKTAIWSTRKTK